MKTLGDYLRDGTLKASYRTSIEEIWKLKFNEAVKTTTIKKAQEKAWEEVEICVNEMIEGSLK